MDLPLHRKCLDFSRRNRKWLLLTATIGASGYGAYRAYNSPYVVQKRNCFIKLIRAFVSVAEMVSNSADTVSLLSHDLNHFLTSDSDEIPNSLKQLSKIAASKEFLETLSRVSESVTLGIVLGCKSQFNSSGEGSSFSDKVAEKLMSKAGTGFVSVVVGSFARNFVLAFFSDADSVGVRSNSDDVPRWVRVICDERCGKLIGDCVRTFVSTAVAVFLDKTMDVNTYDDLFAGLSNPKHHDKVKGILISVCNGAVESFVRTSHQVLTNPSAKRSDSSSSLASVVGKIDGPGLIEDGCLKPEALLQQLRVSGVGDSGWIEQIRSALSVPANRRFVIDVTGRVTLETVRSFVEFLLWRMSDGLKSTLSKVREEVVDRGHEVVRYVGAKSSVILTLCLALYLHILGGSRIIMPA
ncbi:protein PHLOEM PROTEIN 2-LIKE A10-like [Lotus japonicus]|uniref:protein PHLOEM PROTEIN 2-LIKE A10-like n=1 Tax=Lotus japonicus TaxID=34305 RepID=UPI00258F8718|nr:protein PHLOEM PROTEIN 2-LIKE A10-like [Lotus japonicus]